MAIRFMKGGTIRCTDTERGTLLTTYPNLPQFTIVIETNTPNLYKLVGTSWILQGGGGPTDYAWLVYKEGTTYYAKNGLTGILGSESASATTVIQYALDNLTGSRTWKERVKLKGDFTPTTFALNSFTVLDLTDARLFQANATNNNLIKNADTTNGNTDIEIVGGIIDGNKAGQSAGGSEDTQSMIYFEKCSRIWIHHGVVKNGDFHNIRIRYCPSDIKITNMTSLDARHEHISCHSQDVAARGYIISNNYFENVTAGQTFIATVNVDDSVIDNNVCKRTFDLTTGIAINGQRNTVTNNIVTDCSGVSIYAAQAAGENFNTSYCNISNNTIINSGRHGIFIDAGGSGTDSQGIIKGNIVDTVTEGTYSGIAIGSKWSKILCIDNIVHDAGGSGIKVYSGASGFPLQYVKVANNIVYNNGKSLDANDDNRAGIAIHAVTIGDLRDIEATNNRCYDEQGTKTQKFGIRLRNTKNCTVLKNQLENNLTSAISTVTNVGLIIEGNRGDIHEGYTGSVRGRKKFGAYYGNINQATSGDGMFSPQMTFAGTVSVPALSMIEKDRYLRWDTGTTSGVVAGVRVAHTILACRGMNPIFKCRFRINHSTNLRAFIGLKNSANVANDDPLNAIHGIGIGYRSTDTDWQIIHNDGVGATAFTAISPAEAKDTDIHVIEIRALDAIPSFEVLWDENPVQTITSDIPNQLTSMTPAVQIMNTAAESKTIDPFWFTLEQDRV